MTLISSISGTRGTIGGKPGSNLTPVDIVNFASAYAAFVKSASDSTSCTVVIGRDARPSGPFVSDIVSGTLRACGIHVVDLGLSTTPTVEVAVPAMNAQGGIILTASHNPVQWNALKLLNEKGEFISAEEGGKLIKAIEAGSFDYVKVEKLGTLTAAEGWMEKHVEMVLDYPLVDREAIAAADLKILVDGVNSSGGVAVPMLLRALGVNRIININGEPTGQFAHNPEPLKAHLVETCDAVVNNGCDMGIVVDPDVDRLALISEDGSMFGEEYTLVAIADYVLSHRDGPAVSNLSSSRALSDIASKHGKHYHASAVGEVNVVVKMKETDAVIGGEGNGGIIVPDFHYGRDSLIGIALFLTHYVKYGKPLSGMRADYPAYFMAKSKIELNAGMNPDEVLEKMKANYADERINTIDGLKIDFADSWVHLRKSNTEPIIRIYSEAPTQNDADSIAERFQGEIKNLFNTEAT